MSTLRESWREGVSGGVPEPRGAGSLPDARAARQDARTVPRSRAAPCERRRAAGNLPPVIRPVAPPTPLAAAERFALDLLLDLSRVLRADALPADADVARMVVTDRPAPSDLRSLRETGWGIVASEGEVSVPRSVLARIAAVAAGAAEQRSGARDRFGRVPSSENALVAEELEGEPLVSLAAARLRHAALEAGGRRAMRLVAPWPRGHRWAAAVTHDLDVVSLWPAFTLLRLAELARKRQLGRAARVVGAAVGAAAGRPVWDAAREVLDVEARHGVRSTWFVLCGTPTAGTVRAGDLTYRPESRAARRIFAAVTEGGHELGLHGSFETMDRGAALAEQRARLELLVGRPVHGVRQHYLRTRHGRTERDMAAAGFRYDSTWGFADRNGFRLGVADVVPAWDAATASPLGVEAVPFTWMDRSLSKYRGVEEPQRWVDEALALAARCEAVDGLWVGIWHPNLAPALGFPEAPAAFARLVRETAARAPWLCTIGEAVTWRRARRSVRARAIGADGAVAATFEGQAPEAPRLEDVEGRGLEPVVGG